MIEIEGGTPRTASSDGRPHGRLEGSNDDIVIHVRDVEKHFYRFRNPIAGSLRRLVGLQQRPGTYSIFRAVRGVSFKVRRGEVVGVIGANGSGKTTLLKMIAGLLPLDGGSIRVVGKVHALLALGVGVNPEFTGRENIYYAGLLLGMSKAEIREKTPQIVAFAELGDFIDQPFRTFSSGMRARLLFSISMSISPNILIVDEALATGDAAFVQKCFKRITDLLAGGVTLLFVSHNMGQIKQLCDRCLVLERGELVYDGDTDLAIRRYVEGQHRELSASLLPNEATTQEGAFVLGTGEVRVLDLYLTSRGERTSQLIIGEPCELHVAVTAGRPMPSVRFCVEVFTEKSAVRYTYLPSATPLGGNWPSRTVFALPAGHSEIVLRIPAFVGGDGRYSLDIEFFPGSPDYRFEYETTYCYYRRRLQFTAVYADHLDFGRGVLSEIPVASVEVLSLARAE